MTVDIGEVQGPGPVGVQGVLCMGNCHGLGDGVPPQQGHGLACAAQHCLWGFPWRQLHPFGQFNGHSAHMMLHAAPPRRPEHMVGAAQHPARGLPAALPGRGVQPQPGAAPVLRHHVPAQVSAGLLSMPSRGFCKQRSAGMDCRHVKVAMAVAVSALMAVEAPWCSRFPFPLHHPPQGDVADEGRGGVGAHPVDQGLVLLRCLGGRVQQVCSLSLAGWLCHCAIAPRSTRMGGGSSGAWMYLGRLQQVGMLATGWEGGRKGGRAGARRSGLSRCAWASGVGQWMTLVTTPSPFDSPFTNPQRTSC